MMDEKFEILICEEKESYSLSVRLNTTTVIATYIASLYRPTLTIYQAA